MESSNIIIVNDENETPHIPDISIIDANPIVETNKLLEYYNRKWGEYQNKEFSFTELIMEVKNETEINSSDKAIITNHLKLLVKIYKSQNTNIVNCLLLLERFLNKRTTSKVMLNLINNFVTCQTSNIKLINKTRKQSIEEIEKQCSETLNKDNKIVIKLFQLLNPPTHSIKDIKLVDNYFDDEKEDQKLPVQDNSLLTESANLELELELEESENSSLNSISSGINYEEEFKNILSRLESEDLKFHLSSLNSFIDSVCKEFEEPNKSITTTTTQDIKSSIKSYIDTALPILMHDCAAVPFKLDNNEILESSSKPIESLSSKSPNQIRHIICEFLEHYILSSKLYDKIFSLPQFTEKDKVLNNQISKFKNITLKNLDINQNLITTQQIQLIKDKLNEMINYKSPRQKLLVIKQIINIIVKILSKNQKDSNNIIGADLLLPTLIYCFIKSNIKLLNSNLEYISIFRDSSLLENETEYFLVTMVTASTFIENMTSNSITKDK